MCAITSALTAAKQCKLNISPISRYISITVLDKAYLLLITDKKSYTGFQLPPNLMTLNDPER